MTPDIQPPLKAWVTPTACRKLARFPDHIAIKRADAGWNGSLDGRLPLDVLDDVVRAVVPDGARHHFGAYRLIPRDSLPAVLAALGKHADKVIVRNIHAPEGTRP